MSFRTPLTIIRGTFRNLHFLMFLNGFLLASIFYFKMDSSYENGLFTSIKADIDGQINSNDSPDSIAVKAMNVCYHLMCNKGSVFAKSDLGPSLFQSVSVDLMTTRGACGSYSLVLARILQTFNLPVRIAQMKVGNVYAAHNVVETLIRQRWIVLDPTFNLCFVRPDGTLAGFADVQKDWSYYSRQVPAGYNPAYRYEDVRYSNWTKIPVLLPALRSLLNVVIGPERTSKLSLRIIFLDTYSVCLYVALALYFPLLLVTLRKLTAGRRSQHPPSSRVLPSNPRLFHLQAPGRVHQRNADGMIADRYPGNEQGPRHR
jgi:hypothetical protein